MTPKQDTSNEIIKQLMEQMVLNRRLIRLVGNFRKCDVPRSKKCQQSQLKNYDNLRQLFKFQEALYEDLCQLYKID